MRWGCKQAPDEEYEPDVQRRRTTPSPDCDGTSSADEGYVERRRQLWLLEVAAKQAAEAVAAFAEGTSTALLAASPPFVYIDDILTEGHTTQATTVAEYADDVVREISQSVTRELS